MSFDKSVNEVPTLFVLLSVTIRNIFDIEVLINLRKPFSKY